MSFREYLVFETGLFYDKKSIQDILTHKVDYKIKSPLAFFRNYLKEGYFYSAKNGDFMLDDMVFEIGGKNKTKKQLIDVPDAFVVKDEIEYGFGNTFPLWHFGLFY